MVCWMSVSRCWPAAVERLHGTSNLRRSRAAHPWTADMLRIACSIVTSWSLRGSPQCIAFKRSRTCRHLTAVQHNVCHVKGGVILSSKTFSHLCKWLLQPHLNACLFNITKEKKKNKKKNYELQTVTILLLLLLVLLFKYFRDCSASVNAGSQLHL